jgi:signal transduction histidine kinase
VGLAIVKRIVERHGGRAWVEDSSLGGAAFVVTMPAAPPEGG